MIRGGLYHVISKIIRGCPLSLKTLEWVPHNRELQDELSEVLTLNVILDGCCRRRCRCCCCCCAAADRRVPKELPGSKTARHGRTNKPQNRTEKLSNVPSETLLELREGRKNSKIAPKKCQAAGGGGAGARGAGAATATAAAAAGGACCCCCSSSLARSPLLMAGVGG